MPNTGSMGRVEKGWLYRSLGAFDSRLLVFCFFDMFAIAAQAFDDFIIARGQKPARDRSAIALFPRQEICDHCASLSAMALIGRLKRNAVSLSMPLKANEPSPYTLYLGFVFCAGLLFQLTQRFPPALAIFALRDCQSGKSDSKVAGTPSLLHYVGEAGRPARCTGRSAIASQPASANPWPAPVFAPCHEMDS